VITVRAGCFGKLPAHGDFIRHGAGTELLAFDGWIQAGLLAARGRTDWGAVWPLTPPVRFVRRAAGRRVLAGVLVASRDSAGRDYPFVVAATLEGREVERRPELAPLLAERFLDAAEALATRRWEGADHRQVVGEVDRLIVEVDAAAAERRLAELLAATTLERLVVDGAGAWDDGRHLLLANVASLLGPSSRPRFALTLPGAPDADRAAVWLAIVTALRGDLARFPTLATWSSDRSRPGGADAGLRLLLVEPLGEHFLPMALRHVPSDACDLLREGAESQSLRLKAQTRFGAIADQRALAAKELAPRLSAAAR
jgi:type VI secretion system ImpM family protein